MTRYTTIIHTWTAVGLLRAPREYNLHGLFPSLDWAPLWPHPISMHLVATPNPVPNCLLQRFKFHPNSFWYLGDFSLMYKQTSQQRYNIYGTHVYTTYQHWYSHSSFYTSSIFLGRLAVLHSLCPLHLELVTRHLLYTLGQMSQVILYIGPNIQFKEVCKSTLRWFNKHIFSVFISTKHILEMRYILWTQLYLNSQRNILYRRYM